MALNFIIKSRNWIIESKICFITAGEMYYEEIRNEAFPGLDTNCFIRKPIANEDLIQRVKDILSRNNSQDT